MQTAALQGQTVFFFSAVRKFYANYDTRLLLVLFLPPPPPAHNHSQKHRINAQINTRSTFNVFAHKKRIMHSLSHYSVLSYK